MALSWNEIKERASTFSKEWETAISEDADAKSFWDGFFNVFGVNRRRVATFEHKVVKADRKDGYIDLLWKGVLLVEHKSAGKNLDMAHKQAVDYFPGLKDHELPKYICVCNFQNFRLIDLEEGIETKFELKDLLENVQPFGFLAGYQKRTFKDQTPINIEAAYRMGKLHDELKNVGYSGHELEVFLERILFCLFAEDTTIYEKDHFRYYIETKTKEDGSDLGAQLAQIFQTLNTPLEKRFKSIDEDLNVFPFVNGEIFEEVLPIASFNSKMRNIILECAALDWSLISPAIFGSLFQSVMNPVERRNLGAHYTSEKNILKVIKPLFLDELWKEFNNIKHSQNQLKEFHWKLSKLKFLDPACGCGNFLVISYREIRLLELEILRTLQIGTQLAITLDDLVWVTLDQFYGIEIDEWPCRIAEVAMWLIEHQMNMKLTAEFGHYLAHIPLGKTANIINANALRIDWDNLYGISEKFVYAENTNVHVVKDNIERYGTLNVITQKLTQVEKSVMTEKQDRLQPKFDYIFGNPPFIGSKMMTQEQRNEVGRIYNNIRGSKTLDYVSAWYAKASKYLITNSLTKAAFVSTNSITQGEQVSIIWKYLIDNYFIKIDFAHKTFKWRNEAKGNAAVYCVIIGFSKIEKEKKSIFTYEDIKGEPLEIIVSKINPYLVEADNIFINTRQNPICNVPPMNFGNMPLDGGNLLLSDTDKNQLLAKEPGAIKFIKPLISAREFLNNEKRWCLWLVDAEPSQLRKMSVILERIEKVKKFRLSSIAPSTQKFAIIPGLFRDINNPDTYILIPSTSSENREYIPIGFFDKNSIANNSCHIIPFATLYHFGVLTSKMHMTWVKYVCGRLKSDFRYSKDIVYNNFPWPEKPTEQQIKIIENASQRVLDVRADYPNSSLADLYNPLTMPPALVKAHQDLDKAVDMAYRKEPFPNETKRMEFLFELYEKYTTGLFTKEKKKKSKSLNNSSHIRNQDW